MAIFFVRYRAATCSNFTEHLSKPIRYVSNPSACPHDRRRSQVFRFFRVWATRRKYHTDFGDPVNLFLPRAPLYYSGCRWQRNTFPSRAANSLDLVWPPLLLAGRTPFSLFGQPSRMETHDLFLKQPS